jgi:RNA polymerase sigma factor
MVEAIETIEKADNLDERAKEAKQSETELESLIEKFKPFLKSRAAKYSPHSDPHQREELYSTALMAFYEAVRSYDINKGHFFPFVNRVVNLRIIDHIRKSYKHDGKTIPLDETTEEEQTSAQSSVIEEVSIRKYEEDRSRVQLVEEIEQFKAELSSWGITLESVSKQSPKHKNLRETYKSIVAKISKNTDILQTIQIKRYFPVKAISIFTGLPQKKLEHARTFILASLIIKAGDYEMLSEYVMDRG